MAALDDIAARAPLPSWRPVSLIVMGMVLMFVLWASQAEVNQVATAPGMIVPAGRVRVIQHLEGGIVAEIGVQDGDAVTAGQTLIRLDLGSAGLSTAEIQARVDGLMLERARLMAEASGIDLSLPEQPAARQPDMARAQIEAFNNRRRQLRSNLEVLGERKIQRELDLEIIDTRLDSLHRQIQISNQQHEITSQLARSELYPRLGALEMEQGLEQLNAQIAELVLARPLAESALAEIVELEQQEHIRYQREASEQLRDVELELGRELELLERASNQADRTEIISPIDGIVQNLQVNTIGGIVEPGTPILQIVPVDEALIVEARLSPTDIGHVHAGQPATVRLSTYDFFRYGGVEGEIQQISADRNIDADGRAYYLVRIALTSQYLETEDQQQYPILPGMDAEIDIQIGTRTVLEYILQPVLKLRSDSFRDR